MTPLQRYKSVLQSGEVGVPLTISGRDAIELYGSRRLRGNFVFSAQNHFILTGYHCLRRMLALLSKGTQAYTLLFQSVSIKVAHEFLWQVAKQTTLFVLTTGQSYLANYMCFWKPN